MNKEKFTKLANETGAKNCVYFDWTLKLKTSCGKDYLTKQINQPCVMLIGKECPCAKWGKEK